MQVSKASYLKMWSILNETSDPSPEKNISCFARNTVLRGLPFGGVPVVLVLDFLVFLVLLVIFCMIRKKFWDYGRIALVADQEGYNLLWLHTVFAVLYLVLAVILLRRHTSRMKIISKDMANTRKTLLVCSVPETATEESVRLHFLEAYPACQVTDVTLGFDVAQLMHLDSERIKAGKNLHYYECVLDHTGRREMINACLGGHLICCANSEKVDAITYYRTKEQDLLMEFTKQVELVPQRPLGIAFVTLLNEDMANLSSQQRNMMRKLYFFLLFMVLILPSLGLTRCVFLPDRGAFFVNYVIAAALVGSAMELLRLPGLLLYTVRLTCARSAAERKNIKQNQAYEFQYGAQYAGTLCVYTVIVSYSIACPIIMPFGLMYMLLRHVVDKHNMYFAYLPARLDRKVHVGAVNLALAAPIMCLIWLYFFSVLRAGLRASTSLFTLVVLCITVFICLSYTFGILKVFSPHNYAEKEEDEDAAELVEEDTEVYLPRVLYHKSLASTTQAVQFEEFHEESGGSLTRSFSPEEEPSELSESETTESESTL
ncbi:hypothetical protein F2P81_016960 [Scophthalmus maximus]|uniref:CSC1/OSCA1-like 7TM region domain-containing protein n=1 Tax=Scophthalmus maximus TaxID=52904 RepID=A0A6A4SCB3_SCOMX|nr:hypothetical protein F2P81_016960 [Scophthalmus maximus]